MGFGSCWYLQFIFVVLFRRVFLEVLFIEVFDRDFEKSSEDDVYLYIVILVVVVVVILFIVGIIVMICYCKKWKGKFIFEDQVIFIKKGVFIIFVDELDDFKFLFFFSMLFILQEEKVFLFFFEYFNQSVFEIIFLNQDIMGEYMFLWDEDFNVFFYQFLLFFIVFMEGKGFCFKNMILYWLFFFYVLF